MLVRIASYGPQIDQSHGENRLSHIIILFYLSDRCRCDHWKVVSIWSLWSQRLLNYIFLSDRSDHSDRSDQSDHMETRLYFSALHCNCFKNIKHGGLRELRPFVFLVYLIRFPFSFEFPFFHLCFLFFYLRFLFFVCGFFFVCVWARPPYTTTTTTNLGECHTAL